MMEKCNKEKSEIEEICVKEKIILIELYNVVVKEYEEKIVSF